MKHTEKGVLVIVAGAAGEIGTEFIKKIISENYNVVGIIRNSKVAIDHDNFETIQCSLDKDIDIQEKFDHLDLGRYSYVIYLHTIGVDKFNPRNYPNDVKMKNNDPDLYDTTVNSFK
jgi:nucleoside-diphosphate-sugar epimerase